MDVEKKSPRKLKNKYRLPIKKVKSRWHKTLIDDWKEHYSTDFEDKTESVNIEIGVTFDQKLLYLSCYILSVVGPTVQVSFIVTIIMFYMSESMLYTHCKVRNRPVFFDDIPWNSWILKHGGLSDAILGWHYVLVFTLQTVLGVMILCDKYVFLIHIVTKETLVQDDHCIYYSSKPFKALVFLPIWFLVGVLMTGSAKQQKSELDYVSTVADWCMRIEILGLIYLGKDLWTGQQSFNKLIEAYLNFKPLPVINVVPLAIIILHQYWINIPKTFGKQKGVKQGCSSYTMKGIYTARLIIICIFLGLVQPFYMPYLVFRELEENCQPFWLAVKATLPLCFFYFIRCIHIVASMYIGMHFACRALVDLAKSDLSAHWFLIVNPVNGVRIIAVSFVALLAGTVAYTLSLNSLLYLQGLNIIFSRAILSLSILLRERYSRPVVKILQSVYNEETDEIQIGNKQWAKISSENYIVLSFFFLSVLGLLGLAVISDWAIPLIWEMNIIAIAVMAVFAFLALSPLLYIITLLCVKKQKDANSSSKWEIFVCTTMFVVNVFLCACSCFFCAIAFIILLFIGILLYLCTYMSSQRELRKQRRMEEENQNQ